MLHVNQLMTPNPLTCSRHETLMDAARKMWETDIGALPVVDDEGKVMAMLTDRDICMSSYTQGRSLDEIEVESAMSRTVYSVSPHTELARAEYLMREHQIRRLPVVDDDARPVGILSIHDLVRRRSEDDAGVPDEEVARTLQSICQPRRRSTESDRASRG